MSEPKFCKKCAWSEPDEKMTYTMRCLNPKVNAKDSYALSGLRINGTECHTERNKGWASFPACGMKGREYLDSSEYVLPPGEEYHGSLKNLALP